MTTFVAMSKSGESITRNSNVEVYKHAVLTGKIKHSQGKQTTIKESYIGFCNDYAYAEKRLAKWISMFPDAYIVDVVAIEDEDEDEEY